MVPLPAVPATSAFWTSLPPLTILASSLPAAPRVERPTRANATPPTTSSPRSPLLTWGLSAGDKPRTRLLSGYEPDPVPPTTVCASATTPTRRGQGLNSLSSRRMGHDRRRTQRSTSVQAQATATCPPGLLNPDSGWLWEPNGPSPCPTPRYIHRVASAEARRASPVFAPCGTQAQCPHLCRGRSNACTAAAAPWVPRGCPSLPPGPPARIGHSGPLATVRAAGSLTPPRARVSRVSPITFEGAGQGVTPTRPFARRYATR